MLGTHRAARSLPVVFAKGSRRLSTSTFRRPAILGGDPAFPDGIPFVRPAVPALERVMARLAPSYERGILTNGPLVRALEAEIAQLLGVRHAVAVASCTAGLMLALRALELRGPVVLPSFTFSASAHAIAWNGLQPVFADCDRDSFQIDVDDAAARLEGAAALMGTHVFGAPCNVERLEALAREAGIPLILDAAHALGTTRSGRPIGGYGAAEVFSLSPTKPVVAGEGGIVTTNDDKVAAAVRVGLDYGNPGDYDTRFVGLNARMSELHAAVALESLADVDANLEQRRHLAARYREALAAVPGVVSQRVAPGDQSTWKDLTIAIEEEAFGLSRHAVVAGLRAEGVDTRCYFWPPVHLQQSYAHLTPVDLPVTVDVASRVISLPIYPSLTTATVDRVVESLASLQANAHEVSEVDR